MAALQAFNPYLPSYEYVPDGEPHVWGNRVYLYGSHDRFNGYSFCLNDYVCWSAPLNDLADWRYEGVIFSRSQDPHGNRNRIQYGFAAPDMCQGPDGRYYFFYFMGDHYIKVAVCDEPAGRYEYLGVVKYADGVALGMRNEPKMFDPGVFVDDDGRIYLYSGFALQSNPILLHGEKPTVKGAMVFELEPDMLTIKPGYEDVHYIGVPGPGAAEGTGYEGHEFLEAASMRKFGDTYYFVYSSQLSHELCYATSDNPVSRFRFGGVLISNGDIGLDGRTAQEATNFTGNIHGSLIELNGKHYVFYHRQTNRHQFSRQACAERIRFEDGRFLQAETTSCGLNGGPLTGKGVYEARIACNLMSAKGTRFYGAFRGLKGHEPYFTQTGKDRESNPDQYIANMRNGATAGFKYFALDSTRRIAISGKGNARGRMVVSTRMHGEPVASIDVTPSTRITTFPVAALKPQSGTQALYFTFEGTGAFDFHQFELN